MICDKYTLVSLLITNIVNMIQFILYNACMIINNNHPDIHTIRSLIYAKILYDIFHCFKLYICFVNLNNRLHRDLIDFIRFGTKFVRIPLLPSVITYYRIHTSYDHIQTYTNSLMHALFMMNYYISHIVVYSSSIIILYYSGMFVYKCMQKIFKLSIAKNHSNINDECSICLDINCNYTTICGHSFHTHCITRWVSLSNKYECPMCRKNISYQPYK